LLNNPLLHKFETPFNTVPFNEIKLEHFLPAVKIGITKGLENLNNIQINSDKPTFKNTILTLESCSEDLDTALSVYFNLYSSEADDEFQKLAEEISPIISDFSNDIYLNEKLFSRVKVVFENINSLDKEDARLTEKQYKSFVRSGALLSDIDKEKMRDVDRKLSVLSPRFSKNVLNATNAFELWIEDGKELDGLPESTLIAAKESAEAKGRDDAWLFTLQMPSFAPFIKYAKNRRLREKMFMASRTKCTSGEFNNCENILEITQLKFEKAQLLGFDTYADFILADRMAENISTVNKFMDNLFDPSITAAKMDIKHIADYAKELDGIDSLKPWDTSYYSEKLKEDKFGFDDEALRPFFSVDSVLKGAFEIAGKLYNLNFEKLENIQVFHPDVSVFEVTENNEHIGLLYIDLFPRATKKSGAWMNELRSQGLTRGKVERPQVTLTCNLTKPTANTPSLLTLREVETIFHEFGHCLHGLLSDCTYQSIGGTSVKWDFVELPSQIMENWVTEKEALDLFAKHYKTGKEISEEIIDKVRSSRQFLSGLNSIRQLQFGYLDMSYHAVDPREILDPVAHEKEVLNKTQLLELIDGTSISCSFSHIFAGGYSAGYYSYKWAEVLDADAFEKFKEDGIFNKETAKSFRENILSKGNLENPKELYMKFRGAEPSTDALLKREGLIQYANSIDE
jgi:peptidyl-dipeptidase Dcp